jgi:hypothetical protein
MALPVHRKRARCRAEMARRSGPRQVRAKASCDGLWHFLGTDKGPLVSVTRSPHYSAHFLMQPHCQERTYQKRNSDEQIDDQIDDWHHQFLSTLIGVGPDTTIFVPGQGDIPVPVGSALIFSGSKAHAGSGYSTGNRRSHIYFFSSKHGNWTCPLWTAWKNSTL